MAFNPDTEDVLRLLVTVFGIGVFIVAALAYRRQPTTRTLLVTSAFAVFAINGIIQSLDLLIDQRLVLDYIGVLADAVFILLITIAFLKA